MHQIVENINQNYGSKFVEQQIPQFMYDIQNMYLPSNSYFRNGMNDITLKPTKDVKKYAVNIKKDSKKNVIKMLPNDYEQGINSKNLKKINTERDLVEYVDTMSMLIWNDFVNENKFTDIMTPQRKITEVENDDPSFVYKLYKQGPIMISNLPSQNYDDIELLPEQSVKTLGKEKFLCKKQFADLMTSFVNSEKIFTEKRFDKIVKYQYLINSTLENIIRNYKILNNFKYEDILFIYKIY